ncbi:hypothetical protein G8S55_11645 [Clostridium botulinum C]|nr:hypothetical protein [Clostridium botulinum]MCD3217871.1 hypothetical protein [Clostridium botulinum C]
MLIVNARSAIDREVENRMLEHDHMILHKDIYICWNDDEIIINNIGYKKE